MSGGAIVGGGGRGPGMFRPLHALLALIAAIAILLPIAVVRLVSDPPLPPRVAAPVPARIVPPAELPPVEPILLRDLAPGDARALNERVPFVDGANPGAAPYRMIAGADEVGRATDCLAAAVWYEAGDDAVGERAVAQVVLNRLRHPAFPKSVCGVVFQGSERATGCQFTFTCDGAMRRVPSEAAWRRAREIAASALSGAVFAPVGLSTHYHTDWVVPYWSASLDKLARVGTHLFFRWTGWWGTPAAFRRTPITIEPAIGALAALSPAHRMGAALAEADTAVIGATPFFGRAAMPLPSDPDVFITALNPAQQASFAAMAQASCGERAKCKFMGWTDVDRMPFTAAMSPDQMAAMSFSYLRDRGAGLERTLWNCNEFRGGGRACMKRAALRVVPVAGDDDIIPPEDAPRGPAVLTGVRRKPVAAATPAPGELPLTSGQSAFPAAPPPPDRG